MTVIAYDRFYLVADGRATRGTSLVADNIQKIHKVNIKDHGPCAVAMCGALDVLGPYLIHLEDKGFQIGLDDFVGKDEEGELEMRGLIFVQETRQCYEISTNGGFFKIDSPIAIGSGSWIAQHYLTTGYDAIRSVKEACKTELSCGGKLSIYNIKTGELTWL